MAVTAVDPAVLRVLEGIVTRVDGLHGALLSTSEGVPLGRVLSGGGLREDRAEEMETVFAAAFALACEQSGQLGEGKLDTLTAFFDTAVVVHVARMPLVITLVADPTANVGVLKALAPELGAALEPVRLALG